MAQHGMPALQVAVMKKGLTGKRIKDIQRLGTGLSSARFWRFFNCMLVRVWYTAFSCINLPLYNSRVPIY
jgi:hypothetical protein